MDLYWANKNNGAGDVILQNAGNDLEGKATFVEVTMPSFPNSVQSNKVSVADLNQDGRIGISQIAYQVKNTLSAV